MWPFASETDQNIFTSQNASIRFIPNDSLIQRKVSLEFSHISPWNILSHPSNSLDYLLHELEEAITDTPHTFNYTEEERRKIKLNGKNPIPI